MIIPTGFAQANFKFTGTALPYGAEVTLGLLLEGSTTPALLSEDLGVLWESTFLQEQVSYVNIGSVLVKYGPNETGPSAEVANGGVGELVSSALTPNVSMLVHKATALGGRSGRGRFYVPGVREADVADDGTVSSTALAQWQTAANAFATGLAALDVAGVVLHSADAPIDLPTLITSYEVQGRVATQRRRLRR